MQYRREIDGLRAVAVVPVILFHAGVVGFAGGYVGVDVFFVISGYLITTIIVDGLDRGTFSVADFYARRARRIIPALSVVVLATVLLGWLWMSPPRLDALFDSVAAVGSFTSNLYFAGQEGYFAPAAEQQPLLHAWSLAVEEQFYVVFPLVLGVLWNHARRATPVVLALLAGVSLTAAHFAPHGPASGTFFVPHLRAWELLVGCLTAFAVIRWRPSSVGTGRAALAMAGIGAIAVAVVGFDSGTPFPSLWTLLPVLGASAVIVGAAPSNLVGVALGIRPLVGIGLVSYSAYLWHFPLFAFARLRSRDDPPTLLLVGLGAVALVIATVSWRFVERPLRDPVRVPRTVALRLGGLATLVLVAGGLGASTLDGVTSRLDERQEQEFARQERAIDDRPFVEGSNCHISSASLTADVVGRIAACAEHFGPGPVIIGDSHAGDLFNAIARNTTRPFIVGISRGWCRLSAPVPDCPYDRFREWLETHRDEVAEIVYTQKGSYLLTSDTELPVREDAVEAVLSWLRSIRGHEVLWVGPQVEPQIDIRNLNPMVHEVSPDDERRELVEIHEVDSYLQRACAEAEVEYISKIRSVGYQFSRDFLIDGEYTYSDTDHWSPVGEQIFGERLLRNARLGTIFTPR